MPNSLCRTQQLSLISIPSNPIQQALLQPRTRGSHKLQVTRRTSPTDLQPVLVEEYSQQANARLKTELPSVHSVKEKSVTSSHLSKKQQSTTSVPGSSKTCAKRTSTFATMS